MTELRSGPPALRDYELGRLSASTAVSHVHEGRHRYGGQQVLVELLLPEVAGGTGVAERLAAAARRAARLRHPAVVATYDVVNETEALGVVTEPAGGAWLGELAPRGAALPTATAVTIVDGLLAAVEVAHAAGIAHAAICPEVVALTSSGHVRLDGFAVAATLPAGASPSLAPLEFTAPEVRAGAAADGTADLYASAAIAWTLLTGQPPGSADSMGSPPPPALAATLRRALAADRPRRHGTAAELRGALLGAAVASLGPSWRLQSDLEDRVEAALGGREVPVPASVPPAAAANPPSPYVSPPPQHAWGRSAAAPRRRGRRRWWVIGAALAVVAGAAAAAIVVRVTRGSDNAAGPLTVGGDVKVAVVKTAGPGCDNVYTAVATGTLHGTGTLVYRFEHGTERSADQPVAIAGNPGFRFTTSFRFQGTRTGTESVTFVITEPTARRASADFRIACP